MINLGDKVKCKLTGFTGVAVAKTEFINGCIQYTVVGQAGKDNKYPEEISIDEDSLEVIEKKRARNLNEYLDYRVDHLNEFYMYIDFISEVSETSFPVSFDQWKEVRHDEDKLKALSRELKINNLVKNDG